MMALAPNFGNSKDRRDLTIEAEEVNLLSYPRESGC